MNENKEEIKVGNIYIINKDLEVNVFVKRKSITDLPTSRCDILLNGKRTLIKGLTTEVIDTSLSYEVRFRCVDYKYDNFEFSMDCSEFLEAAIPKRGNA